MLRVKGEALFSPTLKDISSREHSHPLSFEPRTSKIVKLVEMSKGGWGNKSL